jgi:hypothetical protein
MPLSSSNSNPRLVSNEFPTLSINAVRLPAKKPSRYYGKQGDKGGGISLANWRQVFVFFALFAVKCIATA